MSPEFFSESWFFYFDEKIPFSKGLVRRVGLYVTVTTFVGLAFISFMSGLTLGT